MYNHIWFHQYQELQVLYQHHDTIVYLTQHVKLLNLCVIKQINKESNHFDQGLMEAKLLTSLHHSGIPTLYNQYETEESIFLVEEYKEGETLYSICQSEQLSFSSIISYGIQLCDILQYLHSQPQPILHLDMNPNNIIVHQERLSLIDFSAAILLESKKYYGRRYGTPGYAAPEQYNQRALSQRTDIYGFGKTLAAMLSGVKRKAGDGQKYLKLERIVKRCTRKNLSRRYHTIRQVGSLLSRLYQEENSSRTKKELDYVVAGTQGRIGTTHLALLLSTYIRSVYGSCLYVEKNHTGNASWLVREQKKLTEAGVYEYEQIPIWLSGDHMDEMLNLRQEFLGSVIDLGVLDENNVQEFLSCPNRILVYGNKAHELAFTKKCLELIPSYAEVSFFGNFMSQQEFVLGKGIIPSKRVYRLPFQPCILSIRDSEVHTLFAKMEKGAKYEA